MDLLLGKSGGRVVYLAVLASPDEIGFASASREVVGFLMNK